MTNQDILTQFEGLIGDSLDQTLEIQLANNAKNKLETEVQPEILKVVDTSLTSTVGGTYLTSYNLPSSPAMLMPLDTIYVGTTPRRAIPFERRIIYKDSSDFYYIDWKQSLFYLCGTIGTSQTITFPYLYATADLTAANVASGSTSIVWPARFHSLIAFEMAFMFFAIDQGEKFRSYSQEWQIAYNALKASFIAWDQRLKLNAVANSTLYGDMTDSPQENHINF